MRDTFDGVPFPFELQHEIEITLAPLIESVLINEISPRCRISNER